METLSTSSLTLVAALTLISYLMGSIPFGLLIARYLGGTDIRTIGSGNIGATNVLRTGKKKLAALTLFLDAIKGTLAVVMAFEFAPAHFQIQTMCFCALACVIGHCFPIFLRFKGGKGVATGFGVIAVLSPLAAITGAVAWISIVKVTKISSLGALIAFVIMPLFYVTLPPQYDNSHGVGWTVTLISAIVLIRHKDNIKRLLRGTES